MCCRPWLLSLLRVSLPIAAGRQTGWWLSGVEEANRRTTAAGQRLPGMVELAPRLHARTHQRAAGHTASPRLDALSPPAVVRAPARLLPSPPCATGWLHRPTRLHRRSPRSQARRRQRLQRSSPTLSLAGETGIGRRPHSTVSTPPAMTSPRLEIGTRTCHRLRVLLLAHRHRHPRPRASSWIHHCRWWCIAPHFLHQIQHQVKHCSATLVVVYV
jgi:hypothetical protein